MILTIDLKLSLLRSGGNRGSRAVLVIKRVSMNLISKVERVFREEEMDKRVMRLHDDSYMSLNDDWDRVDDDHHEENQEAETEENESLMSTYFTTMWLETEMLKILFYIGSVNSISML